MVRPREEDGHVHSLCEKHRLDVTGAASKMVKKWWNRRTLKNTDAQSASRTRVVMQDVYQDQLLKSDNEADEKARQRRVKLHQDQKQLEEVAAAKEHLQREEELHRGRGNVLAVAAKVKVCPLPKGCQNRVDIFDSL